MSEAGDSIHSLSSCTHIGALKTECKYKISLKSAYLYNPSGQASTRRDECCYDRRELHQSPQSLSASQSQGSQSPSPAAAVSVSDTASRQQVEYQTVLQF